MSSFFTIFAAEFKKKGEIMKKILCFILFALLATQMFAHTRETYVGSAYYRPIIGGLYQKDNITGAVFYVDEPRNVMKILSLNPYDIMDGNRKCTYTNVSRHLRKHGWSLLNKNVCEEFIANMSTIEANETLYENRYYHCLHFANIVMESSPNCKYVSIFNPFFTDERRYETTWRYLNVVNEDGSKTVEEIGGFCAIGWREVPLEPQYVTHFPL